MPKCTVDKELYIASIYIYLFLLCCSVKEAKLQDHLSACVTSGKEPAVRHRVEEQQFYVESLRQEIQTAQRGAERELEREQALLRQQQTECE